MNHEGEKPDSESTDIGQPVPGNPNEDATSLASADPTALHAEGAREEVVDTSGDTLAASAAIEEAGKRLAEEAGNEQPPVADASDGFSAGDSADEVDEAAAEDPLEDELDEVDEQLEAANQSPPTGPVELDVPEEEDIQLNWYILKVQSNRERSIAEALRRKIAIESLDHLFGQVLVPTEKVTEFKGGKKKIVERKLWPGYIAVEMHVNDDTWFAIRETSGIGDFTGSAGKPTPMEQSEIARILHTEEEETEEAPKLDIKFSPGDKVKVMEGNFENFEGEVSSIDETHGRVTVMLSIFGRPTPVELEYWQVEGV